MVIRFNNRLNEIYYSIVGLFFAFYFGVPQDVLFVIELSFLILLIVWGKRIMATSIKGIRIFLISILIMIIYGTIMYSTDANMNQYAKGIYHIVPFVIVVFFGYYLFIYFQEKKSIILTFEAIGILLGIIKVFELITHPDVFEDFDSVRKMFANGSYEIGVIVIVLIWNCIYNQNVVISKLIDKLVITILFVIDILSLGRANYISLLSSILVMNIIYIIVTRKKNKIISKFLKITTFIGFFAIVTFIVIPESATNMLMDKFDATSEEISSETNFSDDVEIMNNWRGYEIKKAKEQWSNYNVFEMMFGAGIQQYIKMPDLPAYMRHIQVSLKEDESPVLHNGYYTLLIKGGILAVFGLLFWFLYPFLMLFDKKNTFEQINYIILLISVNIMYLILTYVVRGVVGQGAPICYSLLAGFVYAKYYSQRRTNEK